MVTPSVGVTLTVAGTTAAPAHVVNMAETLISVPLAVNTAPAAAHSMNEH